MGKLKPSLLLLLGLTSLAAAEPVTVGASLQFVSEVSAIRPGVPSRSRFTSSIKRASTPTGRHPASWACPPPSSGNFPRDSKPDRSSGPLPVSSRWPLTRLTDFIVRFSSLLKSLLRKKSWRSRWSSPATSPGWLARTPATLALQLEASAFPLTAPQKQKRMRSGSEGSTRNAAISPLPAMVGP